MDFFCLILPKDARLHLRRDPTETALFALNRTSDSADQKSHDSSFTDGNLASKQTGTSIFLPNFVLKVPKVMFNVYFWDKNS